MGWVDQSKERAEMHEAQKTYGDQINAWLRKHFPDLIDPDGWPHNAAFIAVIHLHARFGKGSLTVAEHGQLIRDAVSASERRLVEVADNKQTEEGMERND